MAIALHSLYTVDGYQADRLPCA